MAAVAATGHSRGLMRERHCLCSGMDSDQGFTPARVSGLQTPRAWPIVQETDGRRPEQPATGVTFWSGVAAERRAGAAGPFRRQIRQPDAQDGRLQLVEAAGPPGAHIAAGLAAVAEQAHAIGQGAVVVSTAPPSPNAPRFLWVEAEAPAPPMVPTGSRRWPYALAAILDHDEAVTVGHRQIPACRQPVRIGAPARWPGARDRVCAGAGVERQRRGSTSAITDCACCHHGSGEGGCHGRHDHLVARSRRRRAAPGDASVPLATPTACLRPTLPRIR